MSQYFASLQCSAVIFLIIYRDLLSTSLTGSGVSYLSSFTTNFVAEASDILVPTDTKIFLFCFQSDRIALHQTRPDFPTIGTCSPSQLSLFSRSSSTSLWCSPSMSKKVLAHPIDGVLSRTPKWDAQPHCLLCRIPLPSTIMTWGQSSGFFYLSLRNSYRVGPSSRKARNPGTYGSFSLTYSYSSQTIFLWGTLQTRRPAQAPSSYLPEKLMSTPATNDTSSSLHGSSSTSVMRLCTCFCSFIHSAFLPGLIVCFCSYVCSGCIQLIIETIGIILSKNHHLMRLHLRSCSTTYSLASTDFAYT